MAKKTVDQMIGQLPPDRQKAILDKAEKINAARASAKASEGNPDQQELEVERKFAALPEDVQAEATLAAQFENLDDVIGRLPPERQAAIEASAEELARAIEASRLKVV